MGVLKDCDERSMARAARLKESRAEARAALTPEELRWIARFKRVVKDMPETLYVIAFDIGGANIFREKPEHGYDVDAVFHERICSCE
jgi:hypothetical protein